MDVKINKVYKKNVNSASYQHFDMEIKKKLNMQGLNYAKKFKGTTKAKRWSLLGPLHSISHTLYDVHMRYPMLAYKNYEKTYKT